MATYTHGEAPQHEGLQLRVYFAGGEVSEIKLVHVEVHENCEYCEGYAWFVYDLISTNCPELYKTPAGGCAYSSKFEKIERFEVIGK